MSERRHRFQWDDDGDSLDEIVLTGVVFHIERMSHHGWWLGVDDRETGERLDMWFNMDREPVTEFDFKSARQDVRGPLSYHGGLWEDRQRRQHRCEVDGDHHKRCRCECGARRANPDIAPDRTDPTATAAGDEGGDEGGDEEGERGPVVHTNAAVSDAGTEVGPASTDDATGPQNGGTA